MVENLSRREIVQKCFTLIDAVQSQDQTQITKSRTDTFWIQKSGLYQLIVGGVVNRDHILRILPTLAKAPTST